MTKNTPKYQIDYANMWMKHTCEILSAMYVFGAIAGAKTIDVMTRGMKKK